MHRRRAFLVLIAASTNPLTTYAFPQSLSASAADNAVCARQDLLVCPSTLPSGFCCPKDTACQSLAGGTTALCCPTGSSCDRIQPIPCDVSLQDPKTNPDGSVLTSIFNVKLQTCDNGCCPFGYTCADKISAAQVTSPQCIRDEDQSKKPGQNSTTTTTTTTTAKPTSTASSTATSSPTVPAQATASPTAGGDGGDKGGMKSNTISIIGGIVGGSLVLLIIIVIAILYIRRRNRAKSQAQRYEKSTFKGPPGGPSSSSAASSHRGGQLNISEPIVQQDSSFRTDFILKSPSAMSSISNKPINSRWSGSTGHNQQRQTFLKPRNLTPSANQKTKHHLSIPNPFSSPNPSATSLHRESVASSSSPFAHEDDDDAEQHAKTGHVVNGRLAPIRNMRPSSRRLIVSRHTEPQHIRREASEESINVFADANAVPSQERAPPQPQPLQQLKSRDIHEEKNRLTTFSDLMDKADLGDVHRGKQRYVPGTTPCL